MGHAYVSNRLHVIYSTYERRDLIRAEMRPQLWAYTAGIGRRLGMTMYEVGGVGDHLHVLLDLPSTTDVATAVQKLKANSSRWMRQNGSLRFAWQTGCGAFSVSASATNAVREYIRAQAEHHKKHTFEEEFISLLRRYGIKYGHDVFD